MSSPSADPGTLRRVQLIELEILRELARRCEEASLRWFVIGGTLLGAARHRGFIPWDDDIDVGMPRADYDRFEALCRRSTDARFAWQSYDTNPAFPFMYGKLLRAGTRAVEAAVAELPIEHSIAIDVFPLDGAPGSAIGRRAHGLAFKVATTTLGAAHPANRLPALWRVSVPGHPQVMGDRPHRRPVPPVRVRRVVVCRERRWRLGLRAGVPAARPLRAARDARVRGDAGRRCPAGGSECLTHVYGDYAQLPPRSSAAPATHSRS